MPHSSAAPYLYAEEMEALRRAGRLRERRLFDPALTDLASNDYLGLAEQSALAARAYARVQRTLAHAPKASIVVNGYHPIHRDFERYIAARGGFESALCVGSGFLANLALIEALPRKKDLLVIDEKYHASGLLGSKLCEGGVVTFRHNDPEALDSALRSRSYHRAIVAVEGIYSMDGDLLAREIFDVCAAHGALLIVDEAHSSGVVGARLGGVFELFGITPTPLHIKMGTLGKAYGSYGAYIACSDAVATYLVNRAKPIIYATAPSLFDIALGLEAAHQIARSHKSLSRAIQLRQDAVEAQLGVRPAGLIVKHEMSGVASLMRLRARLEYAGFVVGAIRPPTVSRPMLRLIARLGVPLPRLKAALSIVQQEGA